MKVIHICQRDDSATGGAVRVAADLVKQLNRTGIDARLIFVYGSRGSFSEDAELQPSYLGRERTSGVLGNVLALRRCLEREKPDIVHHHDGLAWTHLASQLTRIPVVGHGHLFAVARKPTFKTRLTNCIHRHVYHTLFAVGDGVAKSWIKAGFPAERICVVANGVNTERFRVPTTAERHDARTRFGFRSSDQIVLFVGRLDIAMKGCDDFLRLVAALPPAYRGIVAGTGPDLPALEELAFRLQLNERVSFVGHQADTRPVYWAADAFVLTSRYEPFGLVLLEAVSCGLPAIVFPCEGDAPKVANRIDAFVLKDRNIERASNLVIQSVTSDSTDAKTKRHKRCDSHFSSRTCALKVGAKYESIIGPS